MFIPPKPRPTPYPGTSRPRPHRRHIRSWDSVAAMRTYHGTMVPGGRSGPQRAPWRITYRSKHTTQPPLQFGSCAFQRAACFRGFDVIPLTVRFPWERRRFGMDS